MVMNISIASTNTPKKGNLALPSASSDASDTRQITFDDGRPSEVVFKKKIRKNSLQH